MNQRAYTKPNHLDARVKAFNKVHAAANILCPLYVTALAPFQGKKIYKADGSFTKQVEAALPNMQNERTKHGLDTFFHSRSDYAVYFRIRVCQSVEGDSGCVYAEEHFCAGEVANGVLGKLAVPQPGQWRTNYTAQEIIDLRQKFNDAAKIASKAESACSPFGLND